MDVPSFPFARGSAIDVPEEYEALRADTPVARVTTPWGKPAWLVTRYDDVRSVLADVRLSPRFTGFGDAEMPTNDSLLQDPPAHTRLRGLVARAFTARRAERVRPRTEQIVDGLIDRMVEHGPPADLMELFAFQLSMTAICELLGVPDADRPAFRNWSDAFFSLTTDAGDDIVSAGGNLHQYATDLVALRRASPGKDLISELIAVRNEDTDRLSERELVTMAVTLLVAGYIATANTIGLGFLALSEHGGVGAIGRDEKLLVPAVEEILRHQSFGGAARVAREDLEVAGQPVRKGEMVLASVASANRDRGHFVDPDTFDPSRAESPHLAFGFGIHHCLGAALARVQLQVAFGALARRQPGIRPEVSTSDIVWREYLFGSLFGDQGPKTLPVVW